MTLCFADKLKKFKDAFYIKMKEVENNIQGDICLNMLLEAQLFVNTYSDDDPELIEAANKIAASFLDFMDEIYISSKYNFNTKMAVNS